MVVLSACAREMYVFIFIYFTVCFKEVLLTLGNFAICHDDYVLKPADGVLETHTYKWLGFLYYVHVSSESRSQAKAPRVVLVHKQFVLGTANDLHKVPKHYKLGNVIFGDYERDEDECGLTRKQIRAGVTCPPAYFEMPIVEVTAHPEFTRLENTIALAKLLRPLRSAYMLPICLPSLAERKRLRGNRAVYMIDYITSVPYDIEAERMAKRTLKLYSQGECKRRQMKKKTGVTNLLSHALCTTGCGVRSGAVIVRHDPDGLFQLIGVSVGSASCSHPSMRKRFNSEPPYYVDVYHYVSWITSAITASTLPNTYLGNFRRYGDNWGQPKVKKYFDRWKGERLAWRGRTFLAGNSCFSKSRRKEKTAFFYYESFSVITPMAARLNIFMKISAGIECTITCAKLFLPNHKSTPIIDGIGGFNITVQIETKWFPSEFFYTLRLSGTNSTSSNIDRWWAQRGPGMW